LGIIYLVCGEILMTSERVASKNGNTIGRKIPSFLSINEGSVHAAVTGWGRLTGPVLAPLAASLRPQEVSVVSPPW
jgi:hypothetical protein